MNQFQTRTGRRPPPLRHGVDAASEGSLRADSIELPASVAPRLNSTDEAAKSASGTSAVCSAPADSDTSVTADSAGSTSANSAPVLPRGGTKRFSPFTGKDGEKLSEEGDTSSAGKVSGERSDVSSVKPPAPGAGPAAGSWGGSPMESPLLLWSSADATTPLSSPAASAVDSLAAMSAAVISKGGL